MLYHWLAKVKSGRKVLVLDLQLELTNISSILHIAIAFPFARRCPTPTQGANDFLTQTLPRLRLPPAESSRPFVRSVGASNGPQLLRVRLARLQSSEPSTPEAASPRRSNRSRTRNGCRRDTTRITTAFLGKLKILLQSLSLLKKRSWSHRRARDHPARRVARIRRQQVEAVAAASQRARARAQVRLRDRQQENIRR